LETSDHRPFGEDHTSGWVHELLIQLASDTNNLAVLAESVDWSYVNNALAAAWKCKGISYGIMELTRALAHSHVCAYTQYHYVMQRNFRELLIIPPEDWKDPVTLKFVGDDVEMKIPVTPYASVFDIVREAMHLQDQVKIVAVGGKYARLNSELLPNPPFELDTRRFPNEWAQANFEAVYLSRKHNLDFELTLQELIYCRYGKPIENQIITDYVKQPSPYVYRDASGTR
jgi:hypothetical protein